MTIIINFISFISISMRKVLAVASVAADHKELVLKELKNIFKKIKINIEELLIHEMENHIPNEPTNASTLFKSYPYITLSIPNYEQHRQYLEKVYKSNVLFDKFILLISEGLNYEELITNRNEDILKQECRNWNDQVACSFDSLSTFVTLEEQLNKIGKVLGEMDIRGKINKIDAQKKFHLIEDHIRDEPHPDPQVPTQQQTLLRLFFGLELNRGGVAARRRGQRRLNKECSEVNGYQESYHVSEGVSCDSGDEILDDENIENNCWGRVRKMMVKRMGMSRSSNAAVKKGSLKVNPYLKKKHAHEVVVSSMLTTAHQ